MTSIGDGTFYECSNLTTVTIIANGGNAANVKQMMINAGVAEGITWNMPSYALYSRLDRFFRTGFSYR